MRKQISAVKAPIIAAAFVLALLAVSRAAFAGEEGRRNTALALTGATIYHAAKGHTAETLLFGLASLEAWDRTNDREARDWRQRRSYRDRDRSDCRDSDRDRDGHRYYNYDSRDRYGRRDRDRNYRDDHRRGSRQRGWDRGSR